MTNPVGAPAGPVRSEIDIVGANCLGQRASGVDVIELQRLLIREGLLPSGEDDGVFGSKTRGAVIALQQRLIHEGLLPPGADDGIYGPQTEAALQSSTAGPPPTEPPPAVAPPSGLTEVPPTPGLPTPPPPQAPPPPSQAAPAPSAGAANPGSAPTLEQIVAGGNSLRRGQQGDSVVAVRQLLSEAGFELPTGDVFDADMETAVIAFQQSRGLGDDGVVGPATLGALRRGSSGAGTAFLEGLVARNVRGPDRENAIRSAVDAGNVPDFITEPDAFVPVSFEHGGHTITARVSPEVFSIGSNEESVRMPTSMATARWVADHYGYGLPTRELVDAINSDPNAIQLVGVTINCDDNYRPSNEAYLRRDRETDTRLIIQLLSAEERARIAPNGNLANQVAALPEAERQEYLARAEGRLIAGHVKNLVPQSDPNLVGLYGLRKSDGGFWQSSVNTWHTGGYVDYSHGFPVFDLEQIEIDGQSMTVAEARRRYPALSGVLPYVP